MFNSDRLRLALPALGGGFVDDAPALVDEFGEADACGGGDGEDARAAWEVEGLAEHVRGDLGVFGAADEIDLVEDDDLGLVGESFGVFGEFLADGAVGRRGRVVGEAGGPLTCHPPGDILSRKGRACRSGGR